MVLAIGLAWEAAPAQAQTPVLSMQAAHYRIQQFGAYKGHSMCMTAHGHLHAVTIQYCNGSSSQRWRYATYGKYPILSPVSSPKTAISIAPVTYGRAAILRNMSGSKYQGMQYDAAGHRAYTIRMAAYPNHVLGTSSHAPGRVVRAKKYAGCICSGLKSWHMYPS